MAESPSGVGLAAMLWQLLRATVLGFRRNQCFLLAGAIAYYGLLSLIPLLILSALAFAHLVEPATFLKATGPFLEWLVPSQSAALLTEIAGVLANAGTIGLTLLGLMLFFSSLAFSVLDQAMQVIFAHRTRHRSRHPLVATILPYGFVFVLGVALLALTAGTLWLQGRQGFGSGRLGLYLIGLAAEIAILTLIYWLIPAGRTRLRHALLGGAIATAAWEILRHLLLWYFSTLSSASVVYGSLTTAVVTMLCIEVAATLLLFGAQAIAEYEKMALRAEPDGSGEPLH